MATRHTLVYRVQLRVIGLLQQMIVYALPRGGLRNRTTDQRIADYMQSIRYYIMNVCMTASLTGTRKRKKKKKKSPVPSYQRKPAFTSPAIRVTAADLPYKLELPFPLMHKSSFNATDHCGRDARELG